LIYFCDKIQIVFDVKQPKTSKLRVKIIYSKIITFTETRSFVSQEDAGSGIWTHESRRTSANTSL